MWHEKYVKEWNVDKIKVERKCTFLLKPTVNNFAFVFPWSKWYFYILLTFLAAVFYFWIIIKVLFYMYIMIINQNVLNLKQVEVKVEQTFAFLPTLNFPQKHKSALIVRVNIIGCILMVIHFLITLKFHTCNKRTSIYIIASQRYIDIMLHIDSLHAFYKLQTWFPEKLPRTLQR